MRIAAWCSVLVLACAWGCGGDDEPADATSVAQLVGPEGGTVELANGGKVTIPAGALTEETEIKISALELSSLAPLPSTLEVAGKPYAFEPHGIVFAQPVKIEVPYEGDATSVRPAKLDDESDTTWQTVPGSEKDDATKTLSLDTTSFSVFVAVRSDDSVACTVLTGADVANGGTLAEDTCYTTQAALTISDGTLVIEPGVRIAFGPNAYLVVSSAGRLNAVGTEEQPITLTSTDPAGRFRGVQFDGSRSASNVLHYVTIENGGSSGWTGAAYSTAALDLTGNTLVDIQHSTIVSSGGQGLNADGDVEMTFEHNTLRDNAVAAWVHPNAAGNIGANTIFDGNTINVVRVSFGNTDTVTTAQTWHAIAVPFEAQTRTSVAAHLTIAAGATVRFVSDASFIVRDAGALTAVGTTDAPVTFAGSEDLRGYWQGLQITTASTNNVFDHVVFANGGSDQWTGATDSAAMVYLEGNSRALFTNTTFRDSGHYGLWVPGDGDISGFAGNTFTDNARAMIVHPERAGAIAADNTFTDNTENKVRVSFGNTDALTTAQTWNDFGAPFYVTIRTHVDAALTIAPGTEVEFAQDASLRVRTGGSLNATGTIDAPIMFRGGEDLVGYWQGIEYDTASANNTMTQVLLRNAGSLAWFGGANSTSTINVTGSGSLALTDVSFAQTGGYAVIIQTGGSITCASVDDGGFQYFSSATGGALSTCP